MSESSSSSSQSSSLSFTDSATSAECDDDVTTFNGSELSSPVAVGVFNDEDNMLNPCPRSQPDPSLLKQFCLPSGLQWTGVSLKDSRRNWKETGPGEEKVNQLFNTNCNK